MGALGLDSGPDVHFVNGLARIGLKDAKRQG